MAHKAANAVNLTSRRARVLYASLLSAALVAAAWAASAAGASRLAFRTLSNSFVPPGDSGGALEGEGAAVAAAVAGCVSPPTGMVAWYPGDGAANDIRAGRNGALKNGATFAAGKVGQAFSFDGVDDYVQVPHSPSLNTSGSLTLDAWIFVPNDLNTDGTIIGKWGDTGAYQGQRAYLLSYQGNGRIRFRLSDDAHQNDTAFHNFDTVSGLFPFNTWTHVAAVYDRTTGERIIYINGALVARRTNTPPFNITQSTADLGIGAKVFTPNSPNGMFRGRIDEAEVFTRALSQAEIISIYQAGASGKCKDTFIVTNTNDDGAGSLRQAILDANSMPGAQTIAFNIPGAGVHTIKPLTQLPDITGPVVIDGYTQPGSSQNTLAVGDNAVLLIELSGAGGGAATGLLVRSSGSIIRGLVINRFPDRGIDAEPGGGNRIEGCFIGTNAAGTAAAPNGGGILFGLSPDNHVGGATPAARNVISGNSGHGVDIFLNSHRTIVEGNLIGTNAAGTAALPNGGQGVLIHDSNDNSIGGATPAARNVISGNLQNGVATFSDHGVPATGNLILGNFIGTDAAGVAPLGNGQSGVRLNTSNNLVSRTLGLAGVGTPVIVNESIIAFNGAGGVTVLGANSNGNKFVANSFHSNGGLGIDLGGDGVTANDALDADTGPNRLQNFPVLSSAVVSGGVNVSGTLNSTANTRVNIVFYSNPSCDPTGNGEGLTPIGGVLVTTDGAGVATFNSVAVQRAEAGQFVTAAVQNLVTGDESEFSKCVQVAGAQQITVTNTNDDGDGSLRQAVSDIAADGVIDFGPNAKGAITLASELVINKRVTINGPSANLLTLSGGDAHRILNVGPGGEVNVSNLTFSNGGGAGDGGAILNAGRLTLTSCTVSRSTAVRGGGLFNAGAGVLTLTNSTIADNRANARGAGIAIAGGQVTVAACTIAGNASLGQSGTGGGVANLSGALSLRSSIVGDNTSAASPDDIFGAVNSQDYNFIGSAPNASVVGATAHNVTGKSPMLGPLQNNDGPTDTRAPLAGSPVLDAGDNTLMLQTDQRGRPRKVDGDSNGVATVDIGAFESGFSIRGRVEDKDTGLLIGGAGVTLSGSFVPRTAVSADSADRSDANFTIMDVPQGAGYSVTAETSLRFAYAFPSVCVDVSATGTVSDCVTHNAISKLVFVGEKQKDRFATIGGRVTDGAGKGVGGVTLTLSGPKTIVLSIPECQAQDSDCGSYFFDTIPTFADYTLTPTKGTLGFTAQAFDNGRGGADINRLGADGAVALGADFNVGGAPPPPPSDDFTDTATDRNLFKSGVLSLDPKSFEPAVRVAQGNGQLQITPGAFPATTQGNVKTAVAEEPVERFKGYVSVRDTDLNTSTSVSVKADQPLESAGAQTIFSVGSDCENFYRIRVGDPSSSIGICQPASEANAGVRPAIAAAAATGPPMIFFESSTGKGQFASKPFEFDKNTHAFWRLRVEPRTPTLPAACREVGTDAGVQSFVLYETSADRLKWDIRHCATVGAGRRRVAAELLAGIVGPAPRDTGAAKFSDYRVADRTVIKFDPSNPQVVPKDVPAINLKLRRDGDASSAASVVLTVSDAAGAPLLTRTVFFKAEEETAAVPPFASPVTQAAELTLKLGNAEGGAVDVDTARLKVTNDTSVVNRIGETRFFTSQQYCDFLNRPADEDGLDFWSGQFEHCEGAAACVERERIHVSAAFFFSIEFQETGFLVYLTNKAAFGNIPGKPVPVTLGQFQSEVGQLGQNFRVNIGDWRQQLEDNKVAYFQQFADSQRFKDKFGAMKSTEYVDALLANAGLTLSAQEKSALVLILLTQPETGRVVVLRRVAENAEFAALESNRALVLMQYFGYLQRNPDDAPEPGRNFDGYNFWLKKLNDFNGNFVNAEMVKAFLDSAEYKNRFNGHPSPSCEAP